MTPEEINRTIEFILQIQARIEVTQEKHTETLQKHTETLQEMAVQGKRIAELIVIESRRLDEAQRDNKAAQARFEAWEKRNDAWQNRHDGWQNRHDELMREIRNGINRIIDRIGG